LRWLDLSRVAVNELTMDGIYQNETRDEGHPEHLRQAYGFLPTQTRALHYPVGVEDFDYSGWATFHHSAASNDLTVLQDIIVQEGFSHMESRTQCDGHSYTPLLCCCHGNAIQTFDVLIAHGADYMARDECDCGVVEITILSRSLPLFEHILDAGYELSGLAVWKLLMSMLYRRDIDEGREMRYAAMEMTEKLMTRGRRFVDGFLANGGMNAISDIIKECVNLPTEKDAVKPSLESELRQAIKEEEIIKRTSLYNRTLKTLYTILMNMTPAQGATLRSNYLQVISDLLGLSNCGSEEERIYATRCLELVASSPDWGVQALLDTNGIQSLLRGVLLQVDSTGSFNILRAAYGTDHAAVLASITHTEVEVVVSIIESKAGQTVELRVFFLQLLSDILSQTKSSSLLHTDLVISSLLNNIGSADSGTNRQALKLLLDISKAPEGLVTIFKSTNSFLTISNRVVMETEDRFDLCCKLLWKMVHSCGSSQDSVRVVENIGITTVVNMLESLDSEVKCIGAECVKILLNSHKTDHHNQLIAKDVHQKLISMINECSKGHVIYAAMTSLSELAMTWHSVSPIPVVQNAILQSSCIDRVVQVADSCRWHAAKLQSAAFRLIAATLIGNQMTEKRLSNYYLDIMNDISKVTKIDNDTAKHTLFSLCVISLHNLTMESDVQESGEFVRPPTGAEEIMLLSNILKEVRSSVSRTVHYEQLLALAEGDTEDTAERALMYLASVCRFAPSVDALVQIQGVQRFIKLLLECTGRKQASAATALAALSNIESGRTQLLIECKEDPSLADSISELSPTFPLSVEFEIMMRENNSVRDHRRRVLSKESKRPATVSRFPDIGVNLVFDRAISSGNVAVDKVRKKTPIPGDRHFQSMTDVTFSEITERGLSRPYCKVETLPEIFDTRRSWEKPPKPTSHDPRLIATVDRVYKKLYITSSDSISERPATVRDKGSEATSSSGTLPKISQQGLARSLSVVF